MAKKLIIVILTFLTIKVSSFNILETGPNVEVIKGEHLEISCVSDKPWSFCQWSHGGATCNTASQSTTTNCQMSPNNLDRILWIRKDSIKDYACTIKILASEQRDADGWTCMLIAQDSVHIEDDYTYNVTVYEPTSLSFASRPFRQMVVGEQYNIECSGKGGIPEPELVAAIGRPGQTFDEKEDRLLEHLDSSILQNPDTKEITFFKVFKFVPDRVTDQVKDVKCVSLQKRTAGSLIFPPKVVSSPFDLAFRPLPLPAPLAKVFATEGKDTEIKITFYAEPAPRLDQIIWHIVNEDMSKSVTVKSGSENGRFFAYNPQILGTQGFNSPRFGEVVATLLIREVTIEDVKSYCYLEASNENGQYTYNFELTFQTPTAQTIPPPVEPKDDESESSLGTGPIVAIVVTLVLLIIIVVVVVVLLYKKEKACFANTRVASKDEYFHVDAKDVEMQNMKVVEARHSRQEIAKEEERQQQLANELASNLEGRYIGSTEEIDKNLPNAEQDNSFSDQLSPLPPIAMARHTDFQGKKNPNQRDSYKIATATDKYDSRESTYRD